MKIIYVLTMIFMFFSSVQAQELKIENLGVIQDINLRNALSTYYNAEDNCDWHTTYNLRTNEFKEKYNYEYYVQEKNKYSDWDYLNIKIISYSKNNSQSHVEIIFQEKLSKELTVKKFEDDPDIINSLEERGIEDGWIINNKQVTQWRMNKDKNWVVDNPGIRAHALSQF